MGKADLHIHTSYSDGLPDLPAVLRYVQDWTDLDLIAITDHDTIEGALRARDLAGSAGYRYEVIVGAEITTRAGHLLALGLERPVASLRSAEWTIAAVHDQGGICIAPHPLSWLTRSLGARSLDRIFHSPHNDVYLDGLEIWNPSLAGRATRRRAIALNERYGWAVTGSSDAHFLGHLGTAYTEFPGRTEAEFRSALRDRVTVAQRAVARPEHRVPTAQLARQQVKSLIELPARRVNGFLRGRIGARLVPNRSIVPEDSAAGGTA